MTDSDKARAGLERGLASHLHQYVIVVGEDETPCPENLQAVFRDAAQNAALDFFLDPSNRALALGAMGVEHEVRRLEKLVAALQDEHRKIAEWAAGRAIDLPGPGNGYA